jgi:hypothetical protein
MKFLRSLVTFAATVAIASPATFVASPALADSSSSTTCSRMGMFTNCDTTTTNSSSGGGASGAAYGVGLLVGAGIGALIAHNRHKHAEQAFRDAMGAGRCDEALALAQQYGSPRDLDDVKTNCVTPAALAAQQLTQSITASVAAGQCDEAKATALHAGRMDMAEQAMRICTPAQAAAAAVASR